MTNTVDNYLRDLKHALSGCDRATIQDALSDAEEYLKNALDNARRQNPGVNETDSMHQIIDGYGQPEEVAMAYKQMESRIPPGLPLQQSQNERSWWQNLFGVVGEPRAWSAALFMLFSLVTGIIYFTWVVTGLSVSAGLMVLIIGIPLAGVFLLSTRGLAHVEGRLVEALLGIRMPRRPLFSDRSLSLWGRLKNLVTDRYTWTAMVYMLLMLPLGILYFSLFIVLFSVSLWLIFRPVLEYALGLPAFTANVPYFTPGWLMPFSVIGGALLGILSLHLCKAIGKAHGLFAKAMLVRE